MKPARFEYHVPGTVAEAVETLGSLVDDSDAKVLAGGQSLIPLMNMRLAQPDHIVDLRDVAELKQLSIEETSVSMGSMVTQRQVERSVAIAERNPLLVHAIRHIAHFQIRERGTVGGSIAHGDPSAELPLLAVLLNASIEIQGPGERRSVAASDFFVSFLTTLLAEDEIVTRVEWPALGADDGWGFREFSRRRGDFALVATAAIARLSEGRYESVALGFSGVADVPKLAQDVAEIMVGEAPSAELWREVGRRAATAVEPTSDAHATTEDRRDLMRHLSFKVLEDSTARAQRDSAAPNPLNYP